MKIIVYYLGYLLFIISIIHERLKSLYLQEKYYKKIKNIGKCVRFNGVSIIVGLESIEIGNNVHIGNNAHIKADAGLYIGDNTHISRNLVLYTVNHNYKGDLLPYNEEEIRRKVTIENNVWIGMNVIILPGTYIEEGVIIGAGSVVSGRIKKYSIYGASLAKVINYRDKEHYLKLNKNKSFGGVNGEKLHKECS